MDALLGGRVRGQESLRPTAGRALAVFQGVEGVGQFQRETVVGSETVGGELGPPADRGVGYRNDTAVSPRKISSPPAIH